VIKLNKKDNKKNWIRKQNCLKMNYRQKIIHRIKKTALKKVCKNIMKKVFQKKSKNQKLSALKLIMHLISTHWLICHFSYKTSILEIKICTLLQIQIMIHQHFMFPKKYMIKNLLYSSKIIFIGDFFFFFFFFLNKIFFIFFFFFFFFSK